MEYLNLDCTFASCFYCLWSINIIWKKSKIEKNFHHVFPVNDFKIQWINWFGLGQTNDHTFTNANMFKY